jgi:hypothetical protein
MRTMRVLSTVGIAALACGLGCAHPGPAPAANAGSCDLAAHTWQTASDGGCAPSSWRFTRRPDGQWDGREVGCANATAVATHDGSTLTIDITWFDGAARGVFPLDGACKSGPGRIEFTAGSWKGKSASYTMSAAN